MVDCAVSNTPMRASASSSTIPPPCPSVLPPPKHTPPLPTVMEKYTRNARFCLICNYVSKIIPALQSRCTRFRFQPLPQQFVRSRLEYIFQQEGCVRCSYTAVAGSAWHVGRRLPPLLLEPALPHLPCLTWLASPALPVTLLTHLMQPQGDPGRARSAD